MGCFYTAGSCLLCATRRVPWLCGCQAKGNSGKRQQQTPWHGVVVCNVEIAITLQDKNQAGNMFIPFNSPAPAPPTCPPPPECSDRRQSKRCALHTQHPPTHPTHASGGGPLAQPCTAPTAPTTQSQQQRPAQCTAPPCPALATRHSTVLVAGSRRWKDSAAARRSLPYRPQRDAAVDAPHTYTRPRCAAADMKTCKPLGVVNSYLAGGGGRREPAGRGVRGGGFSGKGGGEGGDGVGTRGRQCKAGGRGRGGEGACPTEGSQGG